MIYQFLKAKHWQLFVLTFGIPVIFQFVMMGTMVANLVSKTSPDMLFLFYSMKLFFVVMMSFTGLIFAWIWSIAIGLQHKIPENVNMKVKKFKIFFFIPMAYILCILLFLIGSMNGLMTNFEQPSFILIFSLIGIILIIHTFSIFCILYAIYFAAKTFKTIELQREVSFFDFAGEFFLIWLYPVGVWIIQPQINKMIEE